MRETLAKPAEHPTANAALLLRRAQSGDTAALPELRRLFEARPELWNQVGDLGLQAELSWIDVASGGDALISEALSRRITDLRLELAGLAPSVLERLLVNRVVTCWLQVHYADRMCASAKDVTLQQGEYFQRQQDHAQRRYLSAIRSLAIVRRLQLPTAVQVNIGGQHVNVLDPGAAPASKER